MNNHWLECRDIFAQNLLDLVVIFEVKGVQIVDERHVNAVLEKFINTLIDFGSVADIVANDKDGHCDPVQRFINRSSRVFDEIKNLVGMVSNVCSATSERIIVWRNAKFAFKHFGALICITEPQDITKVFASSGLVQA